MPKPIDTTYNPLGNVMLEEGMVLAHCSKFNESEVNTKSGKSFVYNLEFQLAEELANFEQDVFERNPENNYFMFDEKGKRIPVLGNDGKPLRTKMDKFVGRKIRGNGVFLFPTPKSDSMNERYFRMLEAFHIELKDDVVDNIPVKQLVRLIAEDCIGKPVIIQLRYISYPDDRNKPKEEQTTKWAVNAMEMLPWNEGIAKPAEAFENDDFFFGLNEKPAAKATPKPESVAAPIATPQPKAEEPKPATAVPVTKPEVPKPATPVVNVAEGKPVESSDKVPIIS